MHEQVNEKTVALSVRGTKMTGRLLAKAMRAFLQKARQPKKHKVGQKSLRSLSKQGASLSNIEISGDNIGDFKRIARKYNIEFSLKRDNSGETPNWIVFFKSKDSQSLETAFKEYSAIVLKQKTRKPSLLAKLSKFKALARSKASPVKNRDKGGHEL